MKPRASRPAMRPLLVILATLLLPGTLPRAVGGDKQRMIPPQSALEVIEAQEGKFQTLQWTVTSFSAKLADPSNPDSILPEPIRPFTKVKFAIDIVSGKFRFESESLGRWVNGLEPYMTGRSTIAFDGQLQRELMHQKPVGNPTNPWVSGPPEGAIDYDRTQAFLKKWGALSGLAVFPPYFSSMRLSAYLKDKMARNRPLAVSENQHGQWAIETETPDTLPGVTLTIDYDPKKGGVITGLRYAGGTPPRVYERGIIKLRHLDNGLWVPVQYDDVNVLDKTVGRQTYSNVRVNASIDPKLFAFDFPAGTHLVDHVEKKSYWVGRGVRDDQKEVQEYIERYTKANEEHPNHWWSLRPGQLVAAGASLAALLGLTGWLGFRKLSRLRGAGVLLLLSVAGSTTQAAEQDAQGNWVVAHGQQTIYVSQCGYKVTLFALEFYGVKYNPRLTASALPPTEEGVRFTNIKRVLEGHGLEAVARQKVKLADIQDGLPPDTLAIFPISLARGTNHYVVCLKQPGRAVVLIDVPRAPIALRDVLNMRLMQPQGGAVLFVRRNPRRTELAQALTVQPDAIDLGRFAITGSDANTPEVRTFSLENTSDQPVMVRDLQTPCGCILPDWHGGLLMPGERKVIRLRILKASWGARLTTMAVSCILPDDSERACRVTGEGFTGQQEQRLEVAPDTLRIELPQAGWKRPLEREATIYLYGGEDEPVTTVPRVPWASAEVKRLDGKSSLLRVRVLPPDELADQQSIEGEIWLATKPKRRPVVLRMVLSRPALWRATPALVVLSRVGSPRAEVRLEKTIGEADALTRVDMVAKTPGLTVEVGKVAKDHAALTIHAEGAVRPGIHLVKARLHSASPDSACVVPVVVQVSD